jgi:hypothetical protein
MTKQSRKLKVRHPHGGHPTKEQKDEHEATAIEATDIDTVDLKHPSMETPPSSNRDS